MKKIQSLLILSILASITAMAGCSSTPKAPDKPVVEVPKVVEKPKPAEPTFPSFYEGDLEVTKVASANQTTQYKIGDLTVIHRLTPENDVVSAKLFIAGGTTDYPRDKAGIESLALSLAANGGTRTTPRNQFNTILAQTGSSISSFASDDWSGYELRTVSDSFETIWNLFTQVVFEPAMPQGEFEKEKAQQLANIASRLDSPDSQVNYVADQVMYVDHPYSNDQMGTKESVTNLTLEETTKFQQSLLNASRMILVVVGKVPEEKLIQLVKGSFGRLKGSNTPLPPLPPVVSKPNSYKQVKRALPTYYILGETVAPAPTSAEFYPFLLASSYLSHKLFEEIRTKRNLTYAVAAGVGVHRDPFGYLYVTAVKPKETLEAMYQVIHDFQVNGITPEDLNGTLNTYITRIYMSLETNSSQATLLASRQIIMGDWQQADKIVEQLKKVTPEQIQAVAQKYLLGYRFAVVGPTDDLPATLFDSQAQFAKTEPSTPATPEAATPATGSETSQSPQAPEANQTSQPAVAPSETK